MPIRIKKGELTIEADSESDLRSVLTLFGELPGHEPSNESNGDRISRFLGFIKPPAKKLLKRLLEVPAGQNDVQLREFLRVQDNRALGGIMTSVAKNAKKTKMDYKNLINKEHVNGTDGSLYLYTLSHAFRDLLRNHADDL
jgi:hypothetical protein